MRIASDFRYAFRMLAKSPLFTGMVVLTLALGIGLNTAVFSAVDAILLRPLPGVKAPENIVQVYLRTPSLAYSSLSVPDYLDIQERSKGTFSDVAAWAYTPLSITAGDRPQMVMGQIVSANYFSVLGSTAMMGRTFRPDEDVGRGAHPIAVLTYSGWRDHFGSDPSVVGRSVIINGRQIQVVGIMPKEFVGTLAVIPPVLYVPLSQVDEMVPGNAGALENRGQHNMTGIARLAPGMTVDGARPRMETLIASLKREFPDSYKDSGITLVLQSKAGIHPMFRGAQVGLSGVVMVVVALLLLIACVNVANLFLARARDRAREMAVRISLGAGRAVLVRQLLAESLVFAVVSGLAGLLVASWAIGLANQISLPIDIDFRPNLELSPSVLMFTLGLTVLTGMLFGLVPALQATRPSLVPALKGEAPAGESRSRTSRGLVVAQTALSIVLLTCAALFLVNLRTATTVDKGFESDHLLMGAVDPSLSGYDRARTDVFYRQLRERLLATPGIRSVALTNHVPLSLGSSDRGVSIPGYVPRENEGMSIHYGAVGPGFFATMGIPLLSGREFTAQDDSAAAPSIIVNQRFAERFWPGKDALGRTVHVAGRDRTVIAVVPTGKYIRLGEDPLEYMYLSHAQVWSADATVLVRTDGDPKSAIPILRSEVGALDSDLALAGLRSMNEHLGIALMPARLIGAVLGIFGMLGLILASVGIYGVMAYSVSQRTREIGIRMAVGSSRQMVIALIMRQGLTLVVIGVVIGLAGAIGASRLIRGMLYGDAPLSPAVFVAVPVVLTLVAALATWVPSRRAAALDPLLAIRTE